MQAQANKNNSPSIGAIITPDSLHKLLDQMSEEEKKEMLEHLPDGQKELENVRSNVLSMQLRQAMDSFTGAIRFNRENVEMIMMMADLEHSENNSKDGIEQIIKAFCKKYENWDDKKNDEEKKD